MRKVCVVVFSRANYGRIKTVLRAIRSRPELELQLIVGASALLYRFGNVRDIIERDGFAIDRAIYSIVEGENPTTMAKSTGLSIIEMATLLEDLRPDVVLTVADRFETLSTAVAASYMNIPVAHTQGGEVTGSIDESVRHAVTKLSHIHFPATKRSRDNLLRLGEAPQSIHLTGCPAMDIAREADKNLDPNLFDRYKGVGPTLDPSEPYLVVLQHPVTTEFGSGLAQIEKTIKAVSAIRMQTVWLWPNVDAGSDDISKGLRMFREREAPDYVHFYRNFSPEDYIRLIARCACLVGNSSSAIREGSFLGVPAVNIGSRQSGREAAENVVDTPHDAKAIEAAIRTQVKHGSYHPSPLFGNGDAGVKIADVLATTQLKIAKRLSY